MATAINVTITEGDSTPVDVVLTEGLRGAAGEDGNPVSPFRPTGFTIPGTTPSDAILDHLEMIDDRTVYVDYPENISNTGDLHVDAAAHWEVLNASFRMLENGEPRPDGTWHSDGTVYLQVGTYYLMDQLDWIARCGIQGASPSIYGGGTRLQAVAGGNLESEGVSNYIIRVSSSLGINERNHDSNFNQYFKDIFFNCNDLCSGLLWGGAQMSALENITVRNFPDGGGEGIRIANGTNGAQITNCHAYGRSKTHDSAAFYVEDYVWAAFRTIKPETCGYALKLEGQSQLSFDDVYLESIQLPVKFVDFVVGSFQFTNLSMNGSEPDGEGNYIIIDMGDDSNTGYDKGIVSASGTIRNCPGPCGVYKNGRVYYIETGIGTDHEPWQFDTLNMPPLTGLTATNPPAQESITTGAISSSLIEVSTVATTDDSITLTSGKPNRVTHVVNNGTNRLQIFPRGGSDLGAGEDTPVLLDAGEKTSFHGYGASSWIQI